MNCAQIIQWSGHGASQNSLLVVCYPDALGLRSSTSLHKENRSLWGGNSGREAWTAKRQLHYIYFQQSNDDLGPCQIASFSYFSSSLLALNMLSVDGDLISDFALIGQLVVVSMSTQRHSSIRHQSSLYFASIEIAKWNQ